MKLDQMDLVDLIVAAHRRGFECGLHVAAELPLEGKSEHASENGSAAHLRTEIRRTLEKSLAEDKRDLEEREE